MTGAGRNAEEMRAWRMKILTSTWMAYAGLYFCRKAFYASKNTLSEELHLSTAQLGEIGTAYLIAYTIGQFVSAGMGQRKGARVVLLTGIAASIGCNVVFAFANNYWTLLAFMTFNGLAQATGWPSVVGTIGQWTRRDERGTLMGFWGTCYQLGGVAATAWAGFWLAKQGLQGAFLMASLVTSIAWLAVFFWQRNEPADVGLPPVEGVPLLSISAKVVAFVRRRELTDEVGRPPVVEASATPSTSDEGDTRKLWTRTLLANVALIGVCYFGIKFVRYFVWSWTPMLLETNYGLDADDAAYLSTLFDLAGFAGVIFAGIVSDKLFRAQRALPAFLMLIGMLLGCLCLGLLGPLSLGWFAFSLGLIGFMLFGPDSLLSGAGAVDLGSPRLAVAIAGIINGTGSLGSVVQELLVGRLLDGSSLTALMPRILDGSAWSLQAMAEIAVAADAERLARVYTLLFAASALSLTALITVLIRNRHGNANI